MRELKLHGIHDDGEHVVLSDSDGEQYTLRIDEALRAAVRRDRPALGMIQAAERAPLRPREIQAMLRSGRSAEEIAEIAGVGAEHVRRYEGPVLAERAFIAERARAFHVGRGGGPVFGEVVTQRLRARQATEQETTWDAWRQGDGTWMLQLSFSAGGRAREAHWVVDMTRQSVQAEDDEARWLTEDETGTSEQPGRERPRLSAVRGRVYDVEADGGVEPVQERGTVRPGPWRPVRPDARDEHPASFGDEDLEALNARRGLHPVPAPESGDSATAGTPVDEDETSTHRTGDLGSVWSTLADPGAADPDAEAISEYSREGLEGAIGGDDAEDAEGQDAESQPTEGDAEETVEPVGERAAEDGRGRERGEPVDTSQLTPLPGFDDEDGGAGEAPRKTRPKRTSGRGKRTSMPSWDEIVFGSKSD